VGLESFGHQQPHLDLDVKKIVVIQQEEIVSVPAWKRILSVALSFAMGAFAAYLSWTCNTALEYDVFVKVISAFFAFMFGLVYVVLYALLRWDVCRKSMR